jgi:hypothetical protein
MPMDGRDIGKTILANTSLDLCHELSERLTAAESYFSAYRRLSKTASGPAHPRHREILEKGFSELALASRLVHQLRPILADVAKSTTLESDRIDASPGQPFLPTGNGSGSYRVCFLNQFARGPKVITACQRAIVIRSAKTREDAVEQAKKRFTELEGVPDWHLHATMIEVGAPDAEPSAPVRGK